MGLLNIFTWFCFFCGLFFTESPAEGHAEISADVLAKDYATKVPAEDLDKAKVSAKDPTKDPTS